MAWLTLGCLKPEDRVNLSISMIDACVRICFDALRDQHEAIEEEELLEKARARIMHKRRRHLEV